jgi:hypothetical protein
MHVQSLEDQIETLKLTYETRINKMQSEFDVVQQMLTRFIEDDPNIN